MSKRTKNHHFVPQVLQRRFSAEPSRIWYSERGSDGLFRPPELRNIESAFRIKNYYTVLDGLAPSDVIERKFYGEIDNYLGRMLPSVLAAFGRKEIPTFSGEALDSLRRVIFQMIKRTPEFTKKN